MSRVFTSLIVFAFFGFVLSSGVSAVTTAVHNLQVAFSPDTHSHHTLLSYERKI
ncbi:MAG: hypothetical protein K2X50_04585 [Gammaproteobacteria bacterium]|nr:hypothetical protein [Gammaproteobacteria bacterium]